MLINVKLLNQFKKTLTYKIPQEMKIPEINSIVMVPLKMNILPALVFEHIKDIGQYNFKIREILKEQTFPEDKNYFHFLSEIKKYYFVDPISILSRIKNFITKENEEVEAKIIKNTQEFQACSLSLDQVNIFNSISDDLDKNIYKPSLICGVTGSGKTEIYAKLIEKNFQKGLSCIILLPEVTLSIQIQKKIASRLPCEIKLFSFHCSTSKSEKNEVWKCLNKKEPIVIIGVHMPIILPFSNLGLIIVDEEHEIGYQEKKHPKLNSKELALIRAQTYKIPIVLGSATPSVVSLFNAENKGWKFFKLEKRFSGNFPKIEIVSLIGNKKRDYFWISNELKKAIEDRLSKKEQVIIFLNRRGVNFFVQCKDCAYVFECKNCSVSMTLHENDIIKCHYCSYLKKLPESCPSCFKYELLKKGIGTKNIVFMLEKLFPNANIARADMDATSNKKKWKSTVDDIENEKINIIVGTQTIAKGYHFPKVTLVGVIWADLQLNFPIFNAQETTIQQLIQVAGRAGRDSKDSLVIIQSIGNYEIFKYICETEYLKFTKEELDHRKLASYPPFIRLVQIEIQNSNEAIVEQESILLLHHFQNSKSILAMGPTKPAVAKVKNIFILRIYLKSESFSNIFNSYNSINHDEFKSKIFFTLNPIS